MYVTYDTGPWVAIKMRGNKFHGWLGVGSARFDFNVIQIPNTIDKLLQKLQLTSEARAVMAFALYTHHYPPTTTTLWSNLSM